MNKNSLLESLINADGSKTIQDKTLHDFLTGNGDNVIRLFESRYEELSNTDMFKTKNGFNWLADRLGMKINWGGNFSTPANTDKNTQLGKMNSAKLESAMNKIYRFEDGTMSLKQFLAIHPPVCKKIFTQEYSEKRIHLAYEKLKTPKITYNIGYSNEKYGLLYVEVPKMYYDSLEIPVKE
ncbi:MAG: hypothetical protein PHU53_07710 [Thermoplasmata archaeon]|nr:hypothetical protein [Thermoplasmata archaeon]